MAGACSPTSHRFAVFLSEPALDVCLNKQLFALLKERLSQVCEGLLSDPWRTVTRSRKVVCSKAHVLQALHRANCVDMSVPTQGQSPLRPCESAADGAHDHSTAPTSCQMTYANSQAVRMLQIVLRLSRRS